MKEFQFNFLHGFLRLLKFNTIIEQNPWSETSSQNQGDERFKCLQNIRA